MSKLLTKEEAYALSLEAINLDDKYRRDCMDLLLKNDIGFANLVDTINIKIRQEAVNGFCILKISKDNLNTKEDYWNSLMDYFCLAGYDMPGELFTVKKNEKGDYKLLDYMVLWGPTKK